MRSKSTARVLLKDTAMIFVINQYLQFSGELSYVVGREIDKIQTKVKNLTFLVCILFN